MTALLQQYITALDTFDWWYDYSDDHSVYCKGRKDEEHIRKLREEVDPEGIIYRAKAPKGWLDN